MGVFVKMVTGEPFEISSSNFYGSKIWSTRTVLTRRVSSYGLSAALSDYGVNAAGIAEIVVIFRNDSSLAETPGSFA